MDPGAAEQRQDRRAELLRRTASAAAAAGREVDLHALEAALGRLPELHGGALRVRVLDDLRTGRRQPVHAGSEIPRREMVLDAALLARPRELARIFLHEVLHFVWVRLGNPARRSYEDLLAGERARGELGWSAEMRKLALAASDARDRTRRWREYACESFCDTGAWFFAGRANHPEFTLAARARERRRRWFEELLAGREALRL